MFVQVAEKISSFRHTIIGHAHSKPDIILSVIHLAQEGKVFLSSSYVHPIFFSEIKVYIH